MKLKPLMLLPPLLFGGLAVLFFTSMQREDPDQLPTALAGKEAPQVAVTPLADLAVFDDATLRDGEVKLVNFWASWCAPCRDSFPWMELMHQRYGDKGLAIVAINLDEKREMAGPFLADFKTSFDILYDPKGEVASHFNLQGMPSSYLFDSEGQLVSEHLGFFKSKQLAVEQEIQALLMKRTKDEN